MLQHWEVLSVPIANYERLPRLEAPAGYVYVIQDVDFSARYKIGRTNHPYRRLNKFEVTLPFETRVVHIFRTNDAKRLEYYFHQRFANHRARGEWFDLDDAQLRTLRGMGQRRIASKPTGAGNIAAAGANSLVGALLFSIVCLVCFITLLTSNSASNTSSSTSRSNRSPTSTPATSPAARMLARPNLAVRSITAHSIAFSWSAVRGADRYEYRYQVNNPPPTRWQVAYGFLERIGGLSAGDRVILEVRAAAENARSPSASMSVETNSSAQPSERPTKVPSTDVPPTATATLIATPEATATYRTMFVETRGNRGANARACPQTNCDILVTLRPGDKIRPTGSVEGEVVYGTALWYAFEFNGQSAYVHGELVAESR